MINESSVPETTEYGTEATWKETPDNSQWIAGVEPEKTLPASWWNFFINLFTKSTVKTKADVTNIVEELKSILTAGSVTPNPLLTNQIVTVLNTWLALKENKSDNLAANILTKLKTVDGSGSGLDTDLVRGTTPGSRGLNYLSSVDVAAIAALVLSDLKTVDGIGSGLDADLLDSIESANFIYGSSSKGSNTITNLNGIVKSGFYYILSTGTGVPNVSYNWNILHVQQSDDSFYGFQIAHAQSADGIAYIRYHNGGTIDNWGNWNKLWNAGNDGNGSGLDTDLVRETTPGTRGLAYLATSTVAAIAALILADLKTVDGTGSGLDADLLRGISGDVFFRGNLYVNSGSVQSFVDGIPDGSSGSGIMTDTVSGLPIPNYFTFIYTKWDINSASITIRQLTTNGVTFTMKKSSVWGSWCTEWNSQNDGAGSGLDADTVGGIDSSFLSRFNISTPTCEIINKYYKIATISLTSQFDFRGVEFIVIGGGYTDGAAGGCLKCKVNIKQQAALGSAPVYSITAYDESNSLVQLGYLLSYDSSSTTLKLYVRNLSAYMNCRIAILCRAGNITWTDGTDTWATSVTGLGLITTSKVWHSANDGSGSGLDSDVVRGTTPGAGGLAALAKAGTIWAADNDGSGSGLDADLLDGQHASAFAPIASPAFTGTPSANGIKFPATPVPSADANTLDDYEEGTFTPTVKIGGTVQTCDKALGRYTKIGNLCFLAMYIFFSKTGDGLVSIEGLPFASSAAFNYALSLGISGSSETRYSFAEIMYNYSTSVFLKYLNGTASEHYSDVQLGTSSLFTITGYYAIA